MDKKYDDTNHKSFTEKVFLIPFKILIYPHNVHLEGTLCWNTELSIKKQGNK
mgnify:CR=1 FL=1